MPKCIYCLQEKNINAFTSEHVIPKALGKFQNNLTLTDCVCGECNDYFGREMDRLYARDSFEGLQRGEVGLKQIEEVVSNFIGRRLTMRWGDENEYNGLILEQCVEYGKLAYRPTPQVSFGKKAERGWKFLAEDQLYEMKHLPEGVDLAKGIFIIPERDAGRLTRLLKHKGVSFVEKRQRDASPISKDGRIHVEGTYVYDRIIQRCVSKIAFLMRLKIRFYMRNQNRSAKLLVTSLSSSGNRGIQKLKCASPYSIPFSMKSS